VTGSTNTLSVSAPLDDELLDDELLDEADEMR
jgi:hypothetical protein